MPYTIVGILFIAIILAAGWFICFYNKVINYESDVENDCQQISELLYRKSNLITKLSEIVSCYKSCDYERLYRIFDIDILTLTDLDEKFIIEMDELLYELYNIAETYPEIKLDEDFIILQNQINGLDKTLDSSFRNYNNRIDNYDKFLSVFPNKIAAKILGFKHGHLLKR